jgi:FAD/FMN-containing dehydrogenase
MVGATLGGGVGPYGGLHGLEIDGLQSVRLVTGTGSLINVSATSHPDLWWGMLGAGFNFGIVTSATYQVYDFTNNGQTMNADFRFHASQNGSLYEFAHSFVGRLPDAFSIDIAIAYNEAFGGVSHHLPFNSWRRKVPADITSRHTFSPTSFMLAH